jgi:short-subunit dehydrogenase
MGGRIGIAHEAAYCASKYALCGWSEVMAIDLYQTGVRVKLVLPGPIETEIWDQPDNDAAFYDGPFVPASECAADIAAALEDDGFEYFAPPEFPGGMGRQHEMVVGKTTDVDGFVDMMGKLMGGNQ